ncbi:MAG: HlyD family efflux transporter periplasmic adaptor subunit [Thermoanaerobaculia bacterium]
MSAATPASDSRYLAAARPGKGVEVLAARHGARLERPALKKSLVIRRQVQMGQVSYVVKIPESNKIYAFDEAWWGLIELFDGTRTSSEIREEYSRRLGGTAVDLSLVLDYEEMLRGIEALEQSAAEKNLQLLSKFASLRQRAAKEKSEGFNVLFMLFKVFDPDRILTRTVRYVRWIWRPPTVAIACTCFLFTIGVFATRFDTIWAQTLELYAFYTKPFWEFVQFWIIFTSICFFHEFGHGYVTKMYGGEVHDMGIALLYFTPAFYCDTTDSFLFTNKWQRLWVTIAGIYVEGIICTIATVLWVATYPDTLTHELAYKTMLFTGVSTVFFNINPLVKIDGYYALSSVIEIPELREDSFKYLGSLFQKHILRLNVEVPVVSRRKRRILVVFGMLALSYLAVIMVFVARLLNNFYSRVVPEIAVVLLLLTLYLFFRNRVRLVVRVSRLFYLDKKEYLMSPRARASLLAAAGALALLLVVPWFPRTIRMNAVLEPARTAVLDAPEDGVVREVLAREGDLLRAGQPILRLGSPEVETARRADEARLAGAAGEAGRSRSAGVAGEAFLAERHETAAAAGLLSGIARTASLELTSPFEGRLLTARPDDLRGRWVPAGTPLVTVGETKHLSASFPVSERLLRDLAVGETVSLHLAARPFGILSGKIVTIASASRPAGGDDGGESLRPPEMPARIVARVVFENPDGVLRPGMSGLAKIRGPRTSLLAMGGRVLYRWLRSNFW